jgi:hypothetical protein
MGDLTLNSIVATETILNPFNTLGDTSERFAIFVAALSEATSEERIEVYNVAKRLYRVRSRAVHQSRLHDKRDVYENRKQAFALFLKCLKYVTQWAMGTLAAGKACDIGEFKDLYLRSIFRPSPAST